MLEKLHSAYISRRDFMKGITATLLLSLSALLNIPAQSKAAEKAADQSSMKKYLCIVCGYIYDPEKGDTVFQIPPGTPFEKLPDYWVCPTCGAEKDAFEVYE